MESRQKAGVGRGRTWAFQALMVLVVLGGLAASNLPADVSYPAGTPSLGARYDAAGNAIAFRVVSARAQKIDVYLYAEPLGADEEAVFPLAKEPNSSVWAVTVPVADLQAKGITGTVYYGYRAWGPNWPHQAGWTKGASVGFSGKDVDGEGNRFNPNKLLIDPYARELSRDPRNPNSGDGSVFASGPDHRLKDSGRLAPKGIVLKPDGESVGTRPARPLKDEIIYEVHLRGLTKRDPSVPADLQGTYAGAALKADYLKELGVTAVEFLPVHEFDNDHNDVEPGPNGDDYWGYATLGFFAPERRYAKDQSPGGPTREFKRMVKAFHDRGIKVYLDVVYNHTGEGGLYPDPTDPDKKRSLPDVCNLLSWRGLDNRTYYELTNDNKYYYDNTGVNGNFNCANSVVRDLILDSLKYWSQVMGVDGFRFDLAPVLGNVFDHQQPSGEGFLFDKMPGNNPLNRAARELPARRVEDNVGVDLIAEPWNGAGEDGQQQGNFPSGWAEWNDRFRDVFRRSQNKLGFEEVTLGDVATRLAGSSDLYQDDFRKPWHSINFIVAHDGPCLRDLYSYNIDGRKAWDQGGNAVLQRQAARNGFALPMLSAGVPMFTGGDEMYRTQKGDDNPYNVDDHNTHLNWADLTSHPNHVKFCRMVIAFRKAHPALRPAEYYSGTDHNHNGLPDIAWLRRDGSVINPNDGDWSSTAIQFLGYLIDGTEFGDPAHSIYVGYNWGNDRKKTTFPAASAGKAWYLASDTASWMESKGNFTNTASEDRLNSANYEMDGRSLVVLVEK